MQTLHFAVVPKNGAMRGLDHANNSSSVGTATSGEWSKISQLLRDAADSLEENLVKAEACLKQAQLLLQMRHGGKEHSNAPLQGGLATWQQRNVIVYIETHMGGTIKIEDLSALTRLSPSHFSRAFKVSFRETPYNYIIRKRVELAKDLMLASESSLSEIALDCGLSDQAHLSNLFRRIVGNSPHAWRREQRSRSS